jgi:drug/metabolite transporter (DMT)-like permease
MESAIVFILSALCGWICYSIAAKKKRDKELWAVLGVVFGIFAIIIIVVLPKL